MKTWKTLAKENVYALDWRLRVELHTVELPDGRVIDDWPWIVTPDYVDVLAATCDGRYLCFRQPKYAVEGISLATIGGLIDEGEAPLAAAQRELLEETGYAADTWVSLGSYAIHGNRGVCTGNLFMAKGAHPITERHADDLEEQELLFLTRDELLQAVLAGQFKQLSWTTTVALALLSDGQ